MSDLATNHADALAEKFGGPGGRSRPHDRGKSGASTGSRPSDRSQAARPRRLRVSATGGLDAPLKVARLLRRDKPRRAGPVVMSVLAAGPVSRPAMAYIGRTSGRW